MRIPNAPPVGEVESKYDSARAGAVRSGPSREGRAQGPSALRRRTSCGVPPGVARSGAAPLVRGPASRLGGAEAPELPARPRDGVRASGPRWPQGGDLFKGGRNGNGSGTQSPSSAFPGVIQLISPAM